MATAIAQEKGQQQLLQGIESFDATKLKPTETQEKNPLPTKEGIWCIWYFLDWFVTNYFF